MRQHHLVSPARGHTLTAGRAANAKRALDARHERDVCFSASAHHLELHLGMFPALVRGVGVAEGSLVPAGDAVAVFAVEEAAAGLGARGACASVASE